MWTSLLQERLSKAVKSPWKLLTPIWEPARLSKGNKPYVITLCLFGEFYRVTFEHVGQFQLSLGSGEGLNVCRNGWLNRCDQCHHEGEDGSTSVALPEVQHAWEVKLWWLGRLEQFNELAAMADLEQYPVLHAAQCPHHGTFLSVHSTTVSDVSPRVFKEFKVMLPHQRHRKEMFTSVTIIIVFTF